MKNIALIGSTGSIGTQTLNVVRRYPEKFNIVSLAAGYNDGVFLEQVKEFKPLVATLSKEIDKDRFISGTEYFFGEDAFLDAVIDNADIVVVALVGFKGIKAVLKAIEMGKTIALANKESLVVGGEFVMEKAKEKGVKILPIDSEHSAIWQALNFDFNTPFNRIILTASGGAFRDYTKEQLDKVTFKDALNHPNWKMGAKITVDCATLVNKAFEVIEAKWLYNSPLDKIDVIIHHQSIIHSMVEMSDNSVIAQMSYPSMEIPIALSLCYPERIVSDVKSLDFASLKSLTFEELDHKRFPCFNVVIEAAKAGGDFPALVNGANEQAVELFMQGKIGYNDIYKALYGVLQAYYGSHHVDYEHVVEADAYARKYVKELFNI